MYRRLPKQPIDDAIYEQQQQHQRSNSCSLSNTRVDSALLSSLHAGSLLFVGLLWSVLIGFGIRCRSLLVANLQSHSLADYADRQALNWLACSHGVVVFLFVPLWSGLIDLFKISYRLCSALVGLATLVSCVLSAGLLDPGHLVITDAVMSGTASSIGLAVLGLIIDEHFPESSRIRVLATTSVQGNSLATFFLVSLFAHLLPAVGWRGGFYWLGGCHCAVALAGVALFSRRPDRRWRLLELRDNDDGTSDNRSVIDRIRDRGQWPTRLLSLSQEDFDSSRTVLLWLLERLIAALISDGLFLFLLMRSGLLNLAEQSSPDENHNDWSSPSLSDALTFSAGSSVAFVTGGLLGGLLSGGKLLTVYMLGSLTVTCSLVGWLGIVNDPHSVQWPFALACGVGVGCFNTFAYAASEEATGVPARHMFPFTRLASGVAMATLEVIRASLIDGSAGGDILLALLLLLSIGQISVQLLVRRKSQSEKRSRREKLRNRAPRGSSASDSATNREDRLQLLLLRPTRRCRQSLTIELQ